jgi:hypothetical protein
MDQDEGTYVAVFVSLNLKEQDVVQMEVTSPVGDRWTFTASAVKIGAVSYWGSARLAAPQPVQGVYHFKAMRQDGKVVEEDFPITWGDRDADLPQISLGNAVVSWSPSSLSLGYEFRKKDGTMLAAGDGKSGLAIPKDAASLTLAMHDDASNWTVAKTLPL